MAITINDVAKLSGVSIGTVSRVINNIPGVKESTRRRVLEVCNQYGYRQNLLASSLRGTRTRLIGCILSDLDNPLFSEFALILEQAARQIGYNVIVCHGRAEDEKIHQVIRALQGHRVDGIVLFSSSHQASEIVKEYIDRVPIVLQGIYEDETLHIPAVSVDNICGGRMAAKYLYSLGHRNVVYLGVRYTNASHVLRYQGFKDTASRKKMMVKTLSNDGMSSTMEVGYQLAKKLFFNGLTATAVFAASDNMAIGVLTAAKEFEISVPGELSVLGFDNIRYSALPYIQLTTIDQPKKALVETTLHYLLKFIQSDSESVLETLLIQPSLIERSTCRKMH